MAEYLNVVENYNENEKLELLNFQNDDGGFGLAKNYESDILDTEIALKTLQDLGETEAMVRATEYVVSCQNKDGGFGYQPGLGSNAELSAEIAVVLADCVKDNRVLRNEISDNITLLRSYLDKNKVSLSKLNADNLNAVYQHFNTALFKLKLDGEYDLTDYYELQSKDGGVFDDPLATAKYLELIVLEKNIIKAEINSITFTTDEGNKASVYNSYENVNIAVDSSFKAEEGYLAVEIETPDGETIKLNTEEMVFNTAGYNEGTYRVTAKIINNYNSQIAVSYTNVFTIKHAFEVKGLDVYFANNNYDSEVLGERVSTAHKGDYVSVALMSDVHLKNLEEATDDITISWNLTRKTKVILSGFIIISKKNGKYVYEAEIAPCSDLSYVQSSDGDFTGLEEIHFDKPDDNGVFDQLITLNWCELDTSESCTYVLQSEVELGDTVLDNALSTFFVSGQEMSIVTNADKSELIAPEDDANISVKIREKKTVDIVLATGTEDTELVNKYAERIESIKKELESLGYSVNVGASKSTYLTAKDTFAWEEYDHIDYKEPDRWYQQYNIPKHIIYDGNDIRMVGYCMEGMKDFLYIEGTDETKKVLEFDVKREDNDDWHTLDGAGFLFNTKLEDNAIEGYCVLLQSNGIYLYKINKTDLDKFRNGYYNKISSVGTRKAYKAISNANETHHIKVVVEDNCASVYDNDVAIMSRVYVGNVDGNGYGPITSYGSHYCEQISSFRFSNITMKAIGGKSLSNILNSYEFESYDSRYIIDVAEQADENLVSEWDREYVSWIASNKNITLLSVGNDLNKEQFNALYNDYKDSPVEGQFYEISDETALDEIEQYIISNEENKYIVNEEGNKATDLVFTGTLYDGSNFTKRFEHLYEGEQIDFNIYQNMDNLVVGTDTPLLKDINLTFTDALGKTITTSAPDIYLPVKQYTDKFTNKVITDNDEYLQYTNVDITNKVYNKSDKRTGKRLVSVMNIKDADGNIVQTYSRELPEIMVSSSNEHIETWNTADSAEGEYTIEALVYDGSYLVSESEKKITVKETGASLVEVSGNISLSKKIFKNTDELTITKTVKNRIRNAVDNAKEVIRVVKADTNEEVYLDEMEISLVAFAKKKSEVAVIPVDDFASYENGEYYIYHELVLEDGRVFEL